MMQVNKILGNIGLGILAQPPDMLPAGTTASLIRETPTKGNGGTAVRLEKLAFFGHEEREPTFRSGVLTQLT